MTGDLYPTESPFLEMLGLVIEEWRDGYVRIGLPVRPDHLNRSGVVHGGLLATLLDNAGGFCGLYCAVPGNRRYSVTLSLTSNFLGQASGGVLTAVGHRVSAGRNVYFARSEIFGEDGALLATGSSVHRFRSGSGDPAGVPAPREGGAVPA